LIKVKVEKAKKKQEEDERRKVVKRINVRDNVELEEIVQMLKSFNFFRPEQEDDQDAFKELFAEFLKEPVNAAFSILMTK